MSCQLNLLATFHDIRSARKYLFPEDKDFKEHDTGDGWDDADWGWKDEEAEADDVTAAFDADKQAWLQDCHFSVSPTADLICVAHGDKLVLLSQRWGSGADSDLRYHTVYQGSLKQTEGEKITCVLCLPLASQKRSTQGGADWTCVIVGFSSGYVRMYTESGTLLLSQIFSHEVVHSIRARTYEPPRHPTDSEKHEELSILYRKALVTVDGFSLVQALRACRNQVARATASGSEAVQPPPLAYKKWSLQDQELITDHAAAGLTAPNPFDQMHTASIIGGFGATIRATPPAAHLYITSGSWPFTAFYYAIEGSAQPMLSDVAHAVATKLKSALFSQITAASGWLGFGHSQETQQKDKPARIEPATPLPHRYGLHDKRRQGESVVLSPHGRLAATTDSFGRVVLLDLQRGVAVRMWKGYRDAQVGWVSEREEGRSPPRCALFLVIYAPRRGILEVWAAQHGPRVAAFNVNKWCRLVSPGHGLMGLNNLTYRQVKVQMHHILLVDPEGHVRTLDVPFHLALSDKNSRHARDLHLLKKLKLLLKDQQEESGSLERDVLGVLLELRVAGVLHQALHRLLHTPYLSPGLMLRASQALRAHLTELTVSAAVEGCGDEGSQDYETKTLLTYCVCQEHLLQTYTRLTQLNTRPEEDRDTQEDVGEAGEARTDSTVLERVLGLCPTELEELEGQLGRYRARSGQVRFDDEPLGVVAYLGCFECHSVRSEAGRGTVTASVCEHAPHQAQLASLIFSQPLAAGTSAEFNQLLRDSCIPADHLMSVLLELWLSEERTDLHLATNLRQLIKSVTCIKDVADFTAEVNQVCGWWQVMRDVLSQTHHVTAALVAALVGRSVAMEMAQVAVESHVSTDSGVLDLSEWESVTVDRSEWTVLVKQLESLVSVQCLLNMRATNTQPAISVSVKKVLDGGKGVLPELVAKWLAGEGIPPSTLCEATEDTEEQLTPSSHPIIGELRSLQGRLPHSLDSDVLMANCSWEYLVSWSRDPLAVFPLEQAVAYLRCVNNALLQHGLAAMIWQMFLVKKVSAAALLMEKVGKAPKDRLCRKEVSLSDVSLVKFLGIAAEFLEVILQAHGERQEAAVWRMEDVWVGVSGPSSLVELAGEQKATSEWLVGHHRALLTVLHAVMTFNMKAVKPLSLFDTKGRQAFFKPLQSSPSPPPVTVDAALMDARKQFLCRVMTHAVQTLPSPGSPPPDSPPLYAPWPPTLVHLAGDLRVDVDVIKRHHTVQLYSAGHDKLAEEVLHTVTDHSAVGSDLLRLVGCRLALYVGQDVDRVARCSPHVSAWLKALDPNQLVYQSSPLSDTSVLLGHVVNELTEGQSEYNLAIELVELVQAFL